MLRFGARQDAGARDDGPGGGTGQTTGAYSVEVKIKTPASLGCSVYYSAIQPATTSGGSLYQINHGSLPKFESKRRIACTSAS